MLLLVDETEVYNIGPTSDGATGGPAGHWPTQFCVWPTQLCVWPTQFWVRPTRFFVLGNPVLCSPTNLLYEVTQFFSLFGPSAFVHGCITVLEGMMMQIWKRRPFFSPRFPLSSTVHIHIIMALHWPTQFSKPRTATETYLEKTV